MIRPGILEVPAWLLNMPAGATLSTAELADLFGVCQATVHNWVNRGELPPPDYHSAGHNTRRAPIHKWRVRTIRKFIRKQAAVTNITEPEISGSQPRA